MCDIGFVKVVYLSFYVDNYLLQEVLTATLDLEDVRAYRNANRSRTHLVRLGAFNVIAYLINSMINKIARLNHLDSQHNSIS